jgi:hypothetical protein
MPLKLASVPAPSAASGESEELQALRRGELTLDEFLDRKADRAVARLRKSLSAEEAAAVRDAIRVQLEIDPHTVELIRELTGLDPQRH